jgi:hypothetical protein
MTSTMNVLPTPLIQQGPGKLLGTMTITLQDGRIIKVRFFTIISANQKKMQGWVVRIIKKFLVQLIMVFKNKFATKNLFLQKCQRRYFLLLSQKKDCPTFSYSIPYQSSLMVSY